MAFYDLSKEERTNLVAEIQNQILQDFKKNTTVFLIKYFDDEDTYIRKVAYQSVGRIYNDEVLLRTTILLQLSKLFESDSEHIRQTVINAFGEIGMFQFEKVAIFFDKALFDSHHKVRNAVIGSLKKMGQKNPKPVLSWATQYLNHPEKEIRREICHGIELRGRTHPQDILPLLQKLENDTEKRVRNTLVHVLGQISYKKGCLPTVITALKAWKNKVLIEDAIIEIIDVHSEKRYAKFTELTQEEVIDYISKNLTDK